MCSNCAIARTNQDYRLYDPACLHCGARIIQQMPLVSLGKTECSQRRTAALAAWVAHGHSELQIRAMVKVPLAIKPRPGPAICPVSDGPTTLKPPSVARKSRTR